MVIAPGVNVEDGVGVGLIINFSIRGTPRPIIAARTILAPAINELMIVTF